MEEDKGKQIKYDKYGYRIENLDNYKPKKYYIEPENEEELEKALKTHEDYMKQFKYHEDIPILGALNIKPSVGYRPFENYVFLSVVGGIILHIRKFKEYYGFYFSTYRRAKSIMGWSCTIFSILSIGYFFSSKFQPQHWGVLTPFVLEKKMQNLLDYKFDLYHTVDLIKYEDKSLSKKKILEVYKARCDKIYVERRKIWKELGL